MWAHSKDAWYLLPTHSFPHKAEPQKLVNGTAPWTQKASSRLLQTRDSCDGGDARAGESLSCREVWRAVGRGADWLRRWAVGLLILAEARWRRTAAGLGGGSTGQGQTGSGWGGGGGVREHSDADEGDPEGQPRGRNRGGNLTLPNPLPALPGPLLGGTQAV